MRSDTYRQSVSSDCLHFCQILENERRVDIGSSNTTTHFRISYHSRNIYLDCGSFINISEWIVENITVTETVIHEMIQLEYSVDFISYSACKSVLWRHRVSLDFGFMFQCSVSFAALQPAINGPCLFSSVFYHLCSTTALLHQPFESSNRTDNRFPWGNYHHISFIRVIKSSVLTTSIIWYKRNIDRHKGLSCLQKIVWQLFLANRKSHIVSETWTYRNGISIIMVSGKETLEKKRFIFSKRKIDKEELKDWKLRLPISDARISDNFTFYVESVRS